MGLLKMELKYTGVKLSKNNMHTKHYKTKFLNYKFFYMKQFFFSTALLLVGFSTYATIRTVSNNPSTLAQFNTIQAAINASISGDTVFVHGSPNLYADFTITNKQLVIIGPGWAPNKHLPLTVMVNNCTINGSSCSNTEIQGIVFNVGVFINTANPPDNMRFIRNRFLNQGVALSFQPATYSGYLFEGNVFDNASVTANQSATYQNFLFHNNYFYGKAGSQDASIAGFTNAVNVVFNHNLWFGPASVQNCFGTNCQFLTITNNIFVRRNAANANSSSTFSHNITFNAGINNPWAVNGNVNVGGNVENQDPQMVDQAAVNAGSNNPLLDFTIAAGPANNSGSDGKDMGLLYDAAGSLNWTISRGSRLPYIFSMNIINPTIAQGGTLTVEVEARKNN